MLHSRTQTTMLHKVRAHANIDSNEQADKLAKMGQKQAYIDVGALYEHAHCTPYYFQNHWWHSMHETPDKCPIRH